ncbi:hypothetical protein HPB51_012304 [Rhipicephalus microplus]|uniref:Uncharacterized protein n=1 Tax=Rhipicephalus microplus TaxID=6941 RepID=A0A9J6E8N0_RHIMP|nr:hypothetical protein HPB51_012304 [Rhipicephalus microplus]
MACQPGIAGTFSEALFHDLATPVVDHSGNRCERNPSDGGEPMSGQEAEAFWHAAKPAGTPQSSCKDHIQKGNCGRFHVKWSSAQGWWRPVWPTPRPLSGRLGLSCSTHCSFTNFLICLFANALSCLVFVFLFLPFHRFTIIILPDLLVTKLQLPEPLSAVLRPTEIFFAVFAITWHIPKKVVVLRRVLLAIYVLRPLVNMCLIVLRHHVVAKAHRVLCAFSVHVDAFCSVCFSPGKHDIPIGSVAMSLYHSRSSRWRSRVSHLPPRCAFIVLETRFSSRARADCIHSDGLAEMPESHDDFPDIVGASATAGVMEKQRQDQLLHLVRLHKAESIEVEEGLLKLLQLIVSEITR